MTRHRLKQLLVLLGVLVLATSGLVAWHLRPHRQAFYTDTQTIKTPQQGTVAREILWEPPARLADGLNTTDDDAEPTTSGDGKTLLFVRGKAGQNADIYACHLTPDGWTKPVPLAQVNTPYDELGPTLSADGTSLYFYSDRLGSRGGYDLWAAHRIEDQWQPAVHLGSAVNSPFDDYGPALSPAGDQLYFASNRPKPDPAEPEDSQSASKPASSEPEHRDYDLYVCTLTNEGVGAATPLESLNTAYDECAPAISPFGDFLYFASNRPGGFGEMDLYRARRLPAGPGPADNLGLAINTAANELDPTLSVGGYALHFSSDRATRSLEPGSGAALSRGDYDLYYCTSREVFKEVETTWSRIDWATIWKQIGPNLMWALLALVLILLFFALIQNYKDRKLGLLTRCLLVSLIAHLLLMLLFNVVEVSTTLANAVRGRTRIQVSLISKAAADQIAGQIRGNITEVSMPAAVDPSAERTEVVPDLSQDEPSAILEVEHTPVKQTERPTAQPIVDDSPPQPNETAVAGAVDAQTEPVAAASRLDPAVPLAAKPDSPRESSAPELPDVAAISLKKTTALTSATTQPADWPQQEMVEPASHPTGQPAETPMAWVDAAALHDTDPHATDVDAATPASEPVPRSRIDLNAPDDAPTVNTAEPDGPVPLTIERSVASRVSKPATTTQTPAPQYDDVIEPADSELGQPRQLPDDFIRAVLPRDADPLNAPSAAPASSDLSPRTAQATIAELPAPREGTARVSAPDERRPNVALAAAVKTRADANPSADALSAPPASSLFAQMEPAPTDHGPADPSPLDEPSATPSEAMPQTAPTDALNRQAPTIAVPTLGDIALPATEATAQGQESRPPETPSVAVVTADRLRAQSGPTRDPEQRPAGAELIVLQPEESPEPPEALRDRLTDQLHAEDAPLAEQTRQSETPPVRPAIIATRPELALNVPTEFEPPPKPEPPADAHGIIQGRVTDARTDAALNGAMIRLVLSGDDDVVAMTDQDGRYIMAVPQAPDFFALSASLEGYLPGTANIRLAAIAEKPAAVDFALFPLTESVIALEEAPDVHHLGNDRFEGRINSQFQKPSEGRRFRATFEITDAQIDAQYQRAEVELMAKGVQCPHQIRINGHLLRERLDHSPSRGGFGRFTAQFRPSWLKLGKNRLKITAQSCRGDLDDFEFVNVQIKLSP